MDHLHAVVEHRRVNEVSVLIRALDANGREMHAVPSMRIPCISYEHAKTVVDAYNAPMKLLDTLK